MDLVLFLRVHAAQAAHSQHQAAGEHFGVHPFFEDAPSTASEIEGSRNFLIFSVLKGIMYIL